MLGRQSVIRRRSGRRRGRSRGNVEGLDVWRLFEGLRSGLWMVACGEGLWVVVDERIRLIYEVMSHAPQFKRIE